MEQITAIQLRARLDAQHEPPVVLLDVREALELRYARIQGCVHIPMQEVPRRLLELDPNAETVVLCHHGMRSAQVANFLAGHGFTNIANLSGGIDAWSLQVDPSVRRY